MQWQNEKLGSIPFLSVKDDLFLRRFELTLRREC